MVPIGVEVGDGGSGVGFNRFGWLLIIVDGV
jgi:hypothetical protein